ncbi:MAG: tryptophan synthase subunit alpha [Rhodocyclaceae bacterium]|jgi:tryptophan synthase alpha chain|nr:tryptophan synthase subunit alpha [Rhodocyclaceae bacterium]MCA3082039.1 tryptophan synthase subunit alpha [Rhodocyclaceae bacterium]MCE2723510.1 tryptophan synthase subunit alpha [Betaproteobacteria bacterium]
MARAGSRIEAAFARLAAEHRKALIPFITVGDPTLATTLPLMHELVKAGVDIIELGVPFSDPMADGPVIQRASERALKQGVGLNDVLVCVTQFRTTNQTTPVVLMGYANPIERMGLEVFADAAVAAGVDGVLVVDYPPEESAALLAAMDSRGIATIYLLSPTSSTERIKLVAMAARGYVYYVSLKGVTGAGNIDTQEVGRKIAEIKAEVNIPVGVGFGIRDGATARLVSEVADAVVIGSRIIQEIESSTPDNVVANVGKLVGSFRSAMDA